MQSTGTITAKRESTSVLLLLIVFLSFLRPISPFISDAIGHTFFSDIHHDLLHKNGTDHIDSELKQLFDSKENEEKGKSVSTFNMENCFTYFCESEIFQFFVPSITLNHAEFKNELNKQNTKSILQPPDQLNDSLPLTAYNCFVDQVS